MEWKTHPFCVRSIVEWGNPFAFDRFCKGLMVMSAEELFSHMGTNGMYTKSVGLRGQVLIGKIVEESHEIKRRNSGVFL